MVQLISIRLFAVAGAFAAIAACARKDEEPPAAPGPAAGVEGAAHTPQIVIEEPAAAPAAAAERIAGAVWRRTDAAAAPGSIVLFAPGGAMVMASCVETYRVGSWRAVDDDTIAWSEQPATIEADIVAASADALTLSLTLANETIVQTFERVDADAICPGE